MAVLQYHHQGTLKEETEKLTDRIREELERRFGGAILSKDETEGMFYYHKQSVLQQKVNQPREAFMEGKKAYFELQLSEADKLLSELASKGPSDIAVDVHLILGLTRFAQGNEKGAREAFQEALRLYPERELDAHYFPPKVIRFFGKVKSNFQSEMGHLEIKATPVGADVFINGVRRGVAPLALEIPVGNHHVRIHASHYQTVVRDIQIEENGRALIEETLFWKVQEKSSQFLGVSEQEVGGSDRLAKLTSALGMEIGASKVLLVSCQKAEGKEMVETRVVDVSLRTSYKTEAHDVFELETRSAEIAAEISDKMVHQITKDLKGDPGRYGENRFEGDIILIGHKQKPFYKQPVFWIVIGAAGVGGGVAAALIGSSSASTGTLGIVFQ